MSKGQRGNKEARKPKKAPAPAKPVLPAGEVAARPGPAAPPRLKH
jgi:hypothetical protein